MTTVYEDVPGASPSSRTLEKVALAMQRAAGRQADEVRSSTTEASETGRGDDPRAAATRVSGPTWESLDVGERSVTPAQQRQIWRTAARGLSRIGIDPGVKEGVPTILGTKITVSQIVELAQDGLDLHQIVEQFEGQISEADAREAYTFAVRLIS